MCSDMGDSVEARLLSLLEALLLEARHEGECRGLFVRQSVAAGAVLLTLPWDRALTVQTSVRRLDALERAGVPLTTIPVLQLLSLCEAAASGLVPRGCGWSLLLALNLLAELRDPRSPHAAYVATLPAPQGSLVASVARGPPSGAHLSLCSPAQLRGLACPALEEAVLTERERQKRLHALLFGTAEPAVSLASFSWALALVASRAVGLSLDADASSLRCLLPALDLCNHAAGDAATAAVRLQVGPRCCPLAVQLLATRALPPGTPLVFDYGPRQLRHWAAAYAFVPAEARAEELFEEISAPGESSEAMLVEHDGSGLLRLAELRLLSPARATVCYVVNAAHGPARVVMESADGAQDCMCLLQPAHEAALSRMLAERASSAAARMAHQEKQLEAEAAASGEAADAILLFSSLRAARTRLLRLAADALGAHAALLE